MDTLELTFENRALSLETFKRAMLCGKPIPKYRDKSGRLCRMRPGFEIEQHLIIGGQALILATNPLGTNKNQLLLIVHCSHHQNFSALKDWYWEYLGLSECRLDEARIQRIDCCIDTLLPFDTVRETMYQQRCRTFWRDESHMRGFYFGRFPLQTYTYEKAVDPSCIDLVPEWRIQELAATKNSILCTRIEARFKREKLPVKLFSDLPKLSDINPFSHLTFKAVDDQIVQELTPAARDRVLAYQLRSMQVGAQTARSERNRQGHFQQNVGRNLRTLVIDTTSGWKNRTDRFFGHDTERHGSHQLELERIELMGESK